MVDDGATVASSMTLTAHWTPKQVSYTVIHWWENADDDGYSFHESENKTGLTGTEANAKAKSYDGFTAQPVTKKIIKGDGSTIVSVYYKRNMYDVKFYSYSSWYTSSKEYTDLRITAKYGQDISKQWPTYKGSSTWRTNDGSGAYQVNIGTMPLRGAKFYGPKTGDEYETAYYYVEALPGEASDVTVRGIRYKLDHKDTSPGTGFKVSEEDQYPLTGYTFNENVSTRTGKSYDDAKFYYTRNSYEIKFINRGKVDKSVDKKYQQNISNENYTPARPSSLLEYYEFDGWYDNELCEGEKYVFNGKTMPAQNVTLYAKWTAKKIGLTYNLNNPEGEVVKGTKNVEAGTIANTVLPSATTISDYSFAGWYYADGNGNVTKDAFNANDAITKDTSVIGKWLYNGKLKVVYDPGTEGSNAKVPTDSNIYAGGAKVTVAKNATTTSKKKFLGWKLNGNLYHPGDAFEVNKDLANNDNIITLKAIWGNEESSTTMSYNPGYGRGSVQTVPVKNNASVTLQSEKDFGYQAPETEGKEYYFAGWATSMDDAKNGKATYAAGQTVHVDVNGENVLYATWIEKRVITVKAKDGTATYDGKDHTVSGFEATTFEVNGNKYTVTGLSATVTGKDAGNYTSKVTGKAVVKDAADNNVTKQFTVNTENGSLVISKATVTLKSADLNKEYDGKALVNGKTALATETGWAEGEGATYNFTGSQTVVGSSANAFSYTLKKGTNADNYTINQTEGKLTVKDRETKYEITVKAKDGTATYDGKDHTVSGFEATTFEVNGNKYTVTGLSATVTGKDAGNYTSKVTGKAVVKDAADNNVTKQFTVNTENGSLVINRKKYTVETLDGNKTYDGTPLTAGAKINGIIAGEVVEIKTTKSLTDVGNILNDKYELTWETAKATNYKLDGEKFGTLTVTTQSIDPGTDPEKPNPDYTGAKVNSPSDAVYDGNEHKWIPTVTDKADKKLKAGTDYTVEYSTKNFKDVGTIDVTITGIGNYSGTVTRTYKITPKSVTVTAEDKIKVFGETDPELTAKLAGTLGNDTVDYKLSREAGEAAGKYEITVKGDKLQGNYSVTYVAGTLTITSQSIDPGTDPEKPNPDYTGAKVNSPSDAVYDGNEHKWIPTVTDKADKKLKAGTAYTVEYSTKNFKDVGTIDVTITGIGNYTGTVTRTYKITPKSVTVTADNKSKVFGEADPKFTAKVAGTLGNDTVEYTLSRETGEAAGKYEITVKGDKLQGNYTVSYVAGTLTITSQSIDPGTDPEKPNPDYTGAKVNSPSDAVYDGNEHKWIPTVTDKADKKLEAGTDYTVEYSTKNFKDVGTVEVTITGKGNYSGTVKRSYKVTPKEYTVTTDSATKTYSGTALTAGGKVEGIVSGETVEFTTTGSQTEVGTSKNTYELVWKSAKATNYTLAKESIGELTVKAKSIIPDDKDTPESDKTGITVSEPSDSKYDGKEHKEVLTVTDTKTGKELVAGTDYSVTYSSDLVNAGTVKVTVAGLGNYSGSFTKTYKITKRSVTLTSATVSKVYDGSALTNTSITVSGDGFVEGEGASYEVTGTQTEVGNSANAFEYKLNEKTLASNYNITKVVGTLTITAAPAPVTPTTPSTPSSTTSTTPRTPSAPQVTTPAETVEKETTPKAEPKKEEKVEEEYTPKASPQYYWALINLICAILTVLFGLLLLISKRHKDEDDDEEDDETKQQTNNDDEEKEQEKKRGLFTRVLAVLIAIVSVVFFLVTEDLSLPWTWTDQWTIWMVVIGLVQIVVFFVGRKWKNVDNDDEDEEAQQA